MNLEKPTNSNKRLLSLDFLRGFIMVVLVLESTHLYEHALQLSEGLMVHNFFKQFHHHPWHGLRFWDIIQPAFMFIAGTAMAYSVHKQKSKGVSWESSFYKALRRSGWLFFWGVTDYAVRESGLSFELWNVLTQLSFTMLLAFLIFNWKIKYQLILSFGLLLLTEFLYRYTNIAGFDQPFVDQHNFGNYMDLILMNKINSGGWVAINCLPTAAHTIWGAIAGKMLLQYQNKNHLVKLFVIAGFAGLVMGYLIDVIHLTPIIKRIATSSFTIVTGAWCILGLAASYWWIDIKGHQNYLKFFIVVGMNSIFIYLFFEIVGYRWFNDYLAAITNGLLEIAHIPTNLSLIITSLSIFACEWAMCYFLYRKKIFFKL